MEDWCAPLLFCLALEFAVQHWKNLADKQSLDNGALVN